MLRRPAALALFLTTLTAAWAEPAIVAHRGASGVAPENTLAAFRKAFEQGADAIEGDFYLTKDGHVVCIHDRDTKRTAGVAKQVREATLAELRTMDVGKWKGAAFAGEKIPTLAEVLGALPKGKRVYLEVKSGPEILTALFAGIEASGLAKDQIVIISFHDDVIRQAKSREPDYKAYWLVDVDPDSAGNPHPAAPALIDALTRLGADGVGASADQTIDARYVKAVQDAGFSFHVWTINSPEAARRFVAFGVQSITTDVPGPLRTELGRKP